MQLTAIWTWLREALPRRPASADPPEPAQPDPDAAIVHLDLTRDSVCLADDVDAPHALQLTVDADAGLRVVLDRIVAARWLAYVGPVATWSVEVGGAVAVLGERLGASFIRIAGESALSAAEVPALHLTYHQQQDDEAVLEGLIRRRAAIDDATTELLAVLGALAPPVIERGLEAAAVIRHPRKRIATSQALDASLGYAVGGKGLFDWSWSPNSLARLEPLAERVRQALELRPAP